MTKPTPTKDAWLLLLREGGWWSCAEVTERLFLGPEDGVHGVLHNMFMRGGVKRQKIGKLLHYGVTPDCLVPEGATLKEIQEALNANQPR